MVQFRRMAERIRRPRPGVTVFAVAGAELHRAGAATALRIQVEHLAMRARVITLDEAVRGLSREDHAIDNTVVLTIDDATTAVGETVLPLLVRLHLPATLYVATAFVDEQRSLPTGAESMTWPALGAAAATGLVTIGSLTHRRRRMDRIGAVEAAADIDRSISLIAERTGRPPAHFAFPEGVPGSPAARQIVERRFHSAAAGWGRTNPVAHTDLHALVRHPLRPRTSTADLDGLVGTVSDVAGSVRPASPVNP